MAEIIWKKKESQAKLKCYFTLLEKSVTVGIIRQWHKAKKRYMTALNVAPFERYEGLATAKACFFFLCL